MDPTTESSPILDTLVAMTAESMARCTLDNHSLMLVRLAALAAVDAPPASYLINMGPAIDAGLTLEEAQGVLIAVAPIVGTSRVAHATANLSEALGFALAITEDDIKAQTA